MGVFRQFPYSNFHEMNMDEIIKIVKNMLEEWAQYHAEWDAWMNQMNDDWSNYQEVMNEAWQNMQDFINNYFDNLDVQEEINNKLTAMKNSGELAQIIQPFIPSEVTTWLAAHITQPVGVVIDKSLSVEGACADAKATGDIKSALLGFFNRTGVNGVKAYFDSDHLAVTDIVLEAGVTYTITNRSNIQAVFMTYNDTTSATVSPSTRSFTLTPTKTAVLCAYKNTATTSDYIDVDINVGMISEFNPLNRGFYGFFNETGILGLKRFFSADHFIETDIVLQKGVTYSFVNRSNIDANFFTYDDSTQVTASAGANFTLTPTKTDVLCAYKNTATTSDYIDVDIDMGMVSKLRLLNRGCYGFFNETGILGLKRFFSADHFIETDIVLQKGVTYSFVNRSDIDANFFTYDDSTQVTAPAGTNFTLTPTKTDVLCAYKNTATTSNYIDVDIDMGMASIVRLLNRGFYGLFNETGVLGLKRFFNADHFIETDIVLEKGVTYSFVNRSNITANFFTYDDSTSVTANAGTNFTLTPTKTDVLCAYKNTATTSDYIDVDINMGLAKKINELEEEIIDAGGAVIYTVDINGGGDYTSFSDALVALKNNSTKKIIYIKGGEYDVFEEMGGSAYASTITSSSDWTEANNIVPPNTSIIGVGKVILSYEPTDSEITSDAAQILSPLNIRSGNVSVENIEIHATNCRYAIHDESGDYANTFTHTYKNVKAHKVRGTYGKAQCFGGGLGFNEDVIIENCTFIGNNSPIFSFHNNLQGVSDSSNIIINNSAFVDPTNSNSAIGLYNTYRADGIQRYNCVRLSNCFIGGGVTLGLNGEQATQNTFDLLVIGCNPFVENTSAVSENIYPIVKYNTITA